MVRVALNAADKRLDVCWVVFEFLVSHLFETPASELGYSVTAHFPQGRVVSALGAFDESVEE